MNKCQPISSGKSSNRISAGGRIAAAFVALVIAAGFAFFHACDRQWLDISPILGVCGFKQRFGLPCPGCGWTHSIQAFASGRIGEAFCLQPAAAVFCLAAVATLFFALHIALFGIDFLFLRWVRSPGGCKVVILAAALIILVGWLAALLLTLAGQGQS
ncbi:MAG TPA: DUF2752 domain-containing protein [Anaerohalosphaeraceae bacterium]|nr:DUF2752 domain-containing protein [Anaerohalosphaeraceae bacterium]HOL89924.1 DUF2752 domain-containing protein [Anaerohalosphaeraceae bacterium]HPP57252.1 DUF2752 domain-containing protein [Anaerohalosphaeraceae bacterium]